MRVSGVQIEFKDPAQPCSQTKLLRILLGDPPAGLWPGDPGPWERSCLRVQEALSQQQHSGSAPGPSPEHSS